jgi:hypothetical protein
LAARKKWKRGARVLWLLELRVVFPGSGELDFIVPQKLGQAESDVKLGARGVVLERQ